ncbi:hypothetical protein ACJ2A9_11975 [Anaerobacillus sp. MEB173]|uniref:prenylated flavin chaperone LpdD n=1 Tax=Anaerobacillus sp. MEB173 TaxID=3383345 RepID=UPI003F914730
MISCNRIRTGEDDVIVVTGGTKPHIGAVVIANWINDRVNIISHGFPHHKEEELFIDLAKVWCGINKKTTVITGGIHIDDATKEQINKLVDETWLSFFQLISDKNEV